MVAAVVVTTAICAVEHVVPPDIAPQGVPAPRFWLQIKPAPQVPTALRFKTPLASHGTNWSMLKHASRLAVLQTLHWQCIVMTSESRIAEI